MITASDWRSISKNTLQGFVTLTLSPSGIVLKECSLHARPDGKRWVALPSRPQIDAAGRHRKDPTSPCQWRSGLRTVPLTQRDRASTAKTRSKQGAFAPWCSRRPRPNPRWSRLPAVNRGSVNRFLGPPRRPR
jgi:hypothetical protein